MPAQWSSMPVPWDMLPQTVTLTVQTGSQQSSGAIATSDGTAYTVMGNLQPNSSGDAMLYKRETGNTLYTLFLAPTTTTGVAVASTINHTAKVTIDGVVYTLSGEPMDLCSHGAVLQLSVYRET